METKRVMVSNFCRADISDELKKIAKEGIVEIPENLLLPRQIQIMEDVDPIEAKLKEHRGQLIPVIKREDATILVKSGKGKWMSQKLLSYTRDTYLSDPDVLDDQYEWKRVFDSKAELVIVAVIGDNRSALTVCRNIVSGCQNMDTLVKDAQGALDASRVFLVE